MAGLNGDTWSFLWDTVTYRGYGLERHYGREKVSDALNSGLIEPAKTSNPIKFLGRYIGSMISPFFPSSVTPIYVLTDKGRDAYNNGGHVNSYPVPEPLAPEQRRPRRRKSVKPLTAIA